MKTEPETTRGLNPRHASFAQLLADGVSQTAAYRQIWGKSNRAQASRLATNHNIQTEVQRIRSGAEARADISRDEVLQMLSQIIRSKPSEASLENRLCEIRTTKSGLMAVFPDKGRCIERLCKMLGWDAPLQIRADGEIKIVIGGDA